MSLFETPHHTMTETEKLSIALQQIDNIVSLLEDNEWKTFLYQHLLPIRYELIRQRCLLNKVNPYTIND